MAVKTQEQRRLRRRRRVRAKVRGTAARPRLAVYRSNRGLYAQLIDDDRGHTLAQAAEVGKTLADSAKKAGIEAAVFDRAGYLYHGRVKALADAAREGGLKF